MAHLGPDLTPTKISEDREIVSQMGRGPADIVKQVVELVHAISKYGVITLIFAFPVLLGCYGLYFLWLAVSTPQLNVGKMAIGMFATIFGPGLTIVLLLLFTTLELWDKLRGEEELKSHAKAA
jgi:hypothetical protein